jgi:hypothetical protein
MLLHVGSGSYDHSMGFLRRILLIEHQFVEKNLVYIIQLLNVLYDDYGDIRAFLLILLLFIYVIISSRAPESLFQVTKRG